MSTPVPSTSAVVPVAIPKVSAAALAENLRNLRTNVPPIVNALAKVCWPAGIPPELDIEFLGQLSKDLVGDALGKITPKPAVADLCALETWMFAVKANQVDLLSTPATSTEALVRHFTDSEKRRIDRWRDPLAKHTSEKNSIAQQSLAAIQQDYSIAVKDGRLSAEESFFLSHLLYSSDEERKFIAAVCLRHGWGDRALHHNFNEAIRRDGGHVGAFLETYGDKLIACPFPIHPAGERFDSLTQALLNGTTAVAGGGRSNGFAPSGAGFGGARTVSKDTTKDVQGGGYVPVGTLPNGQQAADVTRLEKANASLAKQVAALERRTIELGGVVYRPGERGRGRGRGRARGGGDYHDGADEGAPVPALAVEEAKDPKRNFWAVPKV